MPHILLVDDDEHIRDVICFALTKAGHTHTIAADGEEALARVRAAPFDLIILDIGLPEIDGLEVCRQIRKTSEIPILFLSARDNEIDRILGLEIGGDDYVTKPFSPRELMARISVILKRTANSNQANGQINQINQLNHGNEQTGVEGTTFLQTGIIKLDTMHYSVSVNDAALSLTAIEFNMLKTFMTRPRMAFTRDQIVTTAYPDNIHVSNRTIDSHIRNIRAKLASAGCETAIETVHGIGFRLGPCAPSSRLSDL